jgi:hypothetical protein
MVFDWGNLKETTISKSFLIAANLKLNAGQGCQIFLDTIYQNEEKYTKLPHYQMAIKYTQLL